MNRLKYIIKISGFILLMLLGIFLFIYGGYDDSPGAQGIALALFIFALVKLIKTIKNSK
jgi:hypothetical protein